MNLLAQKFAVMVGKKWGPQLRRGFETIFVNSLYEN